MKIGHKVIKKISKRINRQDGFVLTIEALLIFTILGIGLFVGLVALRDAVFKYKLSQQDQDFYVFDSSAPPAKVIGKVAGFDEHEAPLVPFIDYGARTDGNGDPINFRALIGVRDDRFTSRQPIFYSGAACDGTACIAGPSAEASYNTGIDDATTTGGVSYLNALQGITYGIGAGTGAVNSPTDIRGWLYRQKIDACSAANLNSIWDSQRVVPLRPCVTIAPSISANGFFDAEAVVGAGVAAANVLAPLTPPFYTNMISTPSTTYLSIPATSELP